MKINQEKVNLYRTGKIGLCYYAGHLQEIANKIEPFVKEYGYYTRRPGTPNLMTFFKPGERDAALTYMDTQWFFEPEEKKNDTTGPVVFDDFFSVMSKNDYEQHATIARRLYETCDNDILLTFRVLKKLITWAQTKNLREKYVCAALVLTELFLTEFKD